MSSSNTPIHVLPPEILGQIFAFAVVAHKNSSLLRHLDPSSYISCCYNFTFVSRYWRSVALGTPSIWSTLFLNNRELCSVMLERSKTADIFVDDKLWRATKLTKPLITKVITEHAPRIVELSLKLEASGFRDLVGALRQRPGSFRPCILRLIVGGENQTLPIAILVQDRLQHFYARGLNLAWDRSQSFPCLTFLTIHSTGSKIPLLEFINALRGMPVLESLLLHDCLPFDSFIPCIQPVHIARLRMLYVTAIRVLSRVSNFLTFITVPAVAKLIFVFKFYAPREDTLRAKLLHFALSLHTLIHGTCIEAEDYNSRCYKYISVSSTSHVGLKISASNTSFELDHYAVYLQLGLSDNLYQDLTLRKILYSFPQSRNLSLRLRLVIRSETLLKISYVLPHLCNVELSHDSAPSFIATMLHSSLPFPKLRHLTLRRTVFDSDCRGRLDILKLQQCLEARSNSNYKLGKLTIVECSGIQNSDVQRLGELVDVEWDKITEW